MDAAVEGGVAGHDADVAEPLGLAGHVGRVAPPWWCRSARRARCSSGPAARPAPRARSWSSGAVVVRGAVEPSPPAVTEPVSPVSWGWAGCSTVAGPSSPRKTHPPTKPMIRHDSDEHDRADPGAAAATGLGRWRGSGGGAESGSGVMRSVAPPAMLAAAAVSTRMMRAESSDKVPPGRTTPHCRRTECRSLAERTRPARHASRRRAGAHAPACARALEVGTRCPTDCIPRLKRTAADFARRGPRAGARRSRGRLAGRRAARAPARGARRAGGPPDARRHAHLGGRAHGLGQDDHVPRPGRGARRQHAGPGARGATWPSRPTPASRATSPSMRGEPGGPRRRRQARRDGLHLPGGPAPPGRGWTGSRSRS